MPQPPAVCEPTATIEEHQPAPPATIRLPEGYRDLGRLAVGGMGEVRRVHEARFQRRVAMKIIHPTLWRDPAGRARFLLEAQLTAALEHPGVVPVFDRGQLADGRDWYTMAEVRGVTLRAFADGRSRLRLLATFLEISRTIAHAHALSILHRDLKPSNIMVTEDGRTLVMDWGLACRIGDDGVAPHSEPLLGTARYLAPELSAGAAPSPAADVFALGQILAQLLMRSPHPPASLPDRDRTGALLPEALRACCAAARAPRAEARPSAAELAASIARWLEGDERRREARALLRRAADLRPRIGRLREAARGARREAQALLSSLPVHAPAARKNAAWARQDEGRVQAREALLLETEVEQLLRGARERAADLPETHQALGDFWWRSLEAAEERGDDDGAARLRSLLLDHDRARFQPLLEPTRPLPLPALPPGAQVHASPLGDQARLLRPDETRLLRPDETRRRPIGPDEPVTRGGWLIDLACPGRIPVRWVETLGRTPSRGPLAPLEPPASLPEQHAFVPGGWLHAGGDDLAIDPHPERSVWVDALVVERTPVTRARYRAFLQALTDGGEHEAALRHAPAPTDRPELAWRCDEHSRWHMPVGDEVHPWSPDAPMSLVRRADALAFAAWQSARDGLPWRLPHELEWEWIARGGDRRPFPWGPHFDPSRCCMARSQAGAPHPASVDAFPDDCTPQGVRCLAGHVREWCANRYIRVPGDAERLDPAEPGDHETLYAVRGGSWSSSNGTLCRSASRFVAAAEDRLVSLGFRLVRSGRGPSAPPRHAVGAGRA